MAKKFFTDIDLQNTSKLTNALLNPHPVDPSTPVPWVPWLNTTEKALKFFDGSEVHVILTSSSDTRGFSLAVLEGSRKLVVPDREQLVVGSQMTLKDTSQLSLQGQSALVIR